MLSDCLHAVESNRSLIAHLANVKASRNFIYIYKRQKEGWVGWWGIENGATQRIIIDCMQKGYTMAKLATKKRQKSSSDNNIAPHDTGNYDLSSLFDEYCHSLSIGLWRASTLRKGNLPFGLWSWQKVSQLEYEVSHIKTKVSICF